MWVATRTEVLFGFPERVNFFGNISLCVLKVSMRSTTQMSNVFARSNIRPGM